MAAAPRRQVPALPAGTYWCSVVSYHDGSALLGTYGPYPSPSAAEDHGQQLRGAGIYPDEKWETKALRLIDLGETP
jgi:hypothetical protein